MSNPASYLLELGTALQQTEATLAERKSVPLTAGLEAAIQIVSAQTRMGRKVIFIGNGGSAAIASHQAVDYWKNGGMRAIAFNDSSLLTCISNDYGYQHVFEKPIEMFAEDGDVLLAISSSGRSENILRGCKAGQAKGCRLITFSGFGPENALRALGLVNFYVPSHSYGYVEIAHLALSHCIVDTIIYRA